MIADNDLERKLEEKKVSSTAVPRDLQRVGD